MKYVIGKPSEPKDILALVAKVLAETAAHVGRRRTGGSAADGPWRDDGQVSVYRREPRDVEFAPERRD